MTMTAEWIAIGLLALLVLVFVLDVAANRQRIPRPKPVPQKKPEAPEGATPKSGSEEKAEPKSEPDSEPVAEAPEKPADEEAPAESPTTPEPEPEPEAPQVSVFERIRNGLGKTRANLTGGFADLFSIGKKVDEDLLEEIETTLLMADVGVTATSEII